jgi:hypothetical protein
MGYDSYSLPNGCSVRLLLNFFSNTKTDFALIRASKPPEDEDD